MQVLYAGPVLVSVLAWIAFAKLVLGLKRWLLPGKEELESV